MNLDPAMSAPVLVAYGSKHGATAEIAERIAGVLRARGVAVDLRPARAVGSVDGYRAIVLGSAVYMRRWRRDPAQLLRRIRRAAGTGPVWLFSSGPFGEMPEDPGKLIPRRVRESAGRAPVREHVLFGGRVPPDAANIIERAMLKNTPVGRRDLRDWDAIAAWAGAIAAALQASKPAARRLQGSHTPVSPRGIV
jgi:menaquinone-dependent protoporphyrinogen oxidase